MKVDNPRFVSPFLHLTALLGSVTDTLNYNWDCSYTNVFPVMVEDLDMDKMRTIIQEAIGLYEEA